MSYTKHVGVKFDEKGHPLTFLGNTIISFFNDQDSTIYTELVFAQEALKGLSFSHKYAVLPPSSFHMTVLSLMNQDHRNTSFWSPFVDPDSKLSHLDSKFKSIIEEVETPQNFRMKIDCCNDYRFVVSPFDEKTNRSLKQYRDEVCEKTGVKLDDHDSYVFHITLFYRLEELTSTENDEMQVIVKKINKRLKEKIKYFDTGVPKFTIFNDMTAYYEDISMRDNLVS